MSSLRLAIILLGLSACAGQVAAVNILTFDENTIPTNPDNGFGIFTFGGLGGSAVLDGPTSFTIDASEFGGIGVDYNQRNFSPATAIAELRLRVLSGNIASGLSAVFVESDVDTNGPNTGEQYGIFFDISALTPDGPFVTLTQPMSSAGSYGGAFGRDPGNSIFDPGLFQFQIQSQFGGTDRLHVEVDYFKIEDPDNPVLSQITVANNPSFTFGTFSEAGVLDRTGANIVLNANPAGAGGPGGGVGYEFGGLDFDASTHHLEISAKLLPTNAAANFNLVLTDRDGEDTGPGEGSEDFYFTIPTSSFNSSGLSTFSVPLGSGSQDFILTTFGFENGGDMLQNFDLQRIQIQSDGMDAGILGIEIASISIVENQGLVGDYNYNGTVDAADYTLWRDNNGTSFTLANRDPANTGNVSAADYTSWQTRFGQGGAAVASAAAVPEPSCLVVSATLIGFVVFGRGRKSASAR